VTFGHLRDLQDLMLRAYVRNMMLFATLPCYLVGAMPRNSAPERVSAAAGDLHRAVSQRPHGAGRSDDARWLR
jgi:hypothetical protein